MAMGRRTDRGRTPGLWIATNELSPTGGHPFYQRLNRILDAHGFDDFVEAHCAPFYAASVGRPSLTPGTYFRLLLIGHFEGIDSERGIAWRTADSLALRGFLGLGLVEATPEHSTISRTRRLIDLETHRAVFTWILQVLATADLVQGKTVGTDATTLEANAALRSIVRRDSGETYQEFLTRLAQASGIETPTRAGSGALRSQTPQERPQHRVAASARPRRAHHENERRADPSRTQGRARGRLGDRCDHGCHGAGCRPGRHHDHRGVTAAAEELEAVATVTDEHTAVIDEVVADKGYHSNQMLLDLAALDLRTYIAEPDRGRRNWTKKATVRTAVYANRPRIRGMRGRALQRRRSERLERPNAHLYETGGMRRIHLRGHANILTRLLVHISGFNLALLMRSLIGIGTPPEPAGTSGGACGRRHRAVDTRLEDHWRDLGTPSVDHASDFTPQHRFELRPVGTSESDF